MKKVVKLEGLCCGNCAAKIEAGIKKMTGVIDVSLSFMTQKLNIEAEESCVDQIMESARILTAKIEPDVVFKVLR